MEEFRGVRFKTIVQTLESRFQALTDSEFSALEVGMRARMETRMRSELEAIPGMPAALEQLGAHPKAVVSNGS